MAKIENLKRNLRRVRYGADTCGEFFCAILTADLADAYAYVRGATTYAFEPTDTTFALLQKTAELNGNIIPVKKDLSDEITSRHFFVNTSGNSGSNRIENFAGTSCQP